MPGTVLGILHGDEVSVFAVVTYLPDLRFADADVTARLTLRDLLSHRSGVGGDHIIDTGRDDDNLERYVATCAALGRSRGSKYPTIPRFSACRTTKAGSSA